MTQNKVMKLWTAFVTAFLALCTALGLITTTAAAAVPQASTTRNSAAPVTVPTMMSPWSWSYSRALPPTMKQRIRAEAHGSSPTCRHRPPADTDTADLLALCDADDSHTAAEADAPLQR
ncbi:MULTISPECIES: DUF6344 domain-containing protein [Streptomyces]|uniref:Secreted protein n=1 Tax=Streptomyces dengpaensis TaxID=2049881 RepID=A0ABN5I3S0_9ACTN|nr:MULTISPECIES: DUF6344 domain-containing protein [Streptomyces]AVH57663.1 hypothetical protein C4B68_19960 [Streptomyces dengpaensis]PIB07832.1 hypothetical protein B1C81_17825 [Streptomyces sp. HG99]